MYVGRMDGIQWQVNQTWDRLDSVEIRVQTM